MPLRDRVTQALASCAFDSRLGGVLLFDVDPDLVLPLAQWLAALLGSASPVAVVDSSRTEDELWERIVPEPSGAGFRPEPGPLAGYRRPPGVVAVPDLTRMSLPGARAAVTTIGADVVHLQRAGQQAVWRPEDRWVAACAIDISRPSAHASAQILRKVAAARSCAS